MSTKSVEWRISFSENSWVSRLKPKYFCYSRNFSFSNKKLNAWCNLNVPCWCIQWSDSLEVVHHNHSIWNRQALGHSPLLYLTPVSLCIAEVRQHSANQSCLWLEKAFHTTWTREGVMFDSLLGTEKSTFDWCSVLQYLQFTNYNIKLTHLQQNFLVLKIKATHNLCVNSWPGSILARDINNWSRNVIIAFSINYGILCTSSWWCPHRRWGITPNVSQSPIGLLWIIAYSLFLC